MLENIKNIVNSHKRLGIFVSGGFDSGFLLYLLNLYRKDNDIEIFIVERHPKSIEFARPVIDYISKKFNYSSKINVLTTNKPDHLAVRFGISEAITKYSLDKIFVGDVQPPKHLSNEKIIKTEIDLVSQPFIDIHKDTLIRHAKDLDILELLDVTNSCEISHTKPCMKCFHCLEKEWAINEVLISLEGTKSID